jgi:hypothetical protein
MRVFFAAAAFALAFVAQAQVLSAFHFDAYAVDSELNGQDGWTVQQGVAATSGLGSVSDDQFASGPHSARLINVGAGSTSLRRGFTQWSTRDAGNDLVSFRVDLFLPTAPLHVVTIELPQLDGMRFVTWNSNATQQQMFAVGNPGSAGGLFNLNKGQWNTLEFRFNGLTGNTAFFANGGIVGARILDVSAVNNFELRVTNEFANTELFVDNIQFEAVPEPASMIVLAAGVAALATRKRMRR